MPMDPINALPRIYSELLRLAAQIESHAERAPYPHVGLKLRQVAREKRAIADMIKGKITSLDKEAAPSPVAVRSGKNHWERMLQDLEDQKSLDEDLIQLAELLAERMPETSRLLRDIVAGQAPHKETLLDMIAKADPQAHQY